MVALAVSGLIAYGLRNLSEDLGNFVLVGSFAYLSGTLAPAVGVAYELKRNATNLRIVCGVFFVVGLLLNFGFVLFGGSQTLYVIACTVSFLIFAFVANVIYGAQQ